MPIKRKRNPPWNWDELILALELYFDNPKSRTSTAVINKSNLPKELRNLRETFYGDGSNTHRNANGIYQKMQNFVNLDPDCKARGQYGRPNGGRFDKVIWDEYHDNLAELKKAAHVTREAITSRCQFPLFKLPRKRLVVRACFWRRHRPQSFTRPPGF